jgi:hypothetical protein
MMKALWFAGVALLGLSVPVVADDLCITLDASNVVVGKHFKIPKKNTCRPFTGFALRGGFYTASVSGDGCVGTDGTTMGLGLVAAHPGIILGGLTLGRLDERIAVNVSLPLVDGPQENFATVYSADGPEQLLGVTALPCGPPASDVPNPMAHLLP